MRNNIVNNKANGITSARKLLSWLFGDKEWSNRQCEIAYKAILEQNDLLFDGHIGEKENTTKVRHFAPKVPPADTK